MRTSRSSVTGGSKSSRSFNSTVDTVEHRLVGTAEPWSSIAVDVDVVAAVGLSRTWSTSTSRPVVLLVVSTAAGDTVCGVVDALS